MDKLFSDMHLVEGVRIITSIPGPHSCRLLQKQREIEGSIVSYPRSLPIAIKRAKGASIEDVDGNVFLDFFSFAGVVNLGHCNPHILEYTSKQQNELVHALDFPTENKLNAIENILQHLPPAFQDKYKVNFVGPSGSDAIEAAVKLAKMKTGRDTFIAFSGSYHGMTSTALALTSDISFRKKFTSPIPNIHFIPFSYCYRCPFKASPSSCELDCAKVLENILTDRHSGISKPAAIIIEPIQGEGGNIVPREGYLEELTRIAHEHDVLVIFDEIQAGFFRTGEFLSSMHSDATPDIITMSKGLGGVGFPIAAVVYRKDIEAWGPGDHVGTFRGNQVSLAGCNGAFDFIKKFPVKEHVAKMSDTLFRGLQNLAAEYDNIGEVRGRGLMAGIEFVKDRARKTPFPEFAAKFKQSCLQRGLIFEIGGHHSNVARLLPPLTITESMIEIGLSIMRNSLDSVRKEIR